MPKALEISENGHAQIEIGGTRQKVSTLLIPELKVGDYVLVYLGHETAGSPLQTGICS